MNKKQLTSVLWIFFVLFFIIPFFALVVWYFFRTDIYLTLLIALIGGIFVEGLSVLSAKSKKRVSPKDGLWTCPSCRVPNYEARDDCAFCGQDIEK